MFKSDKFYIIVSNNSLIIKRNGNGPENIISLQSFIPNVPCYHHLFDEDKKDYIEDIKKQIKELKIKNAEIIFPDDSMDIEADKRILLEFLFVCGAKKIEMNFQCFILSLANKKYVSISKTARTLVMQYIVYNKSVSKKYYDKNYKDIEKIAYDMRHLYADCEYERVPVYVNNINNDMEEFKSIGSLVSLHDMIANIMNYKVNR